MDPPDQRRVSTREDKSPPTGHRVPLDHFTPFPGEDITGPPPFRDVDGSPVFIGSGFLEGSVHPCKIVPSQNPACLLPYNGTEIRHNGRYELLPFDPITMEWVPARNGRVPEGRRAVEGGYEDYGPRLYHAVGIHNGFVVPGKTGKHLRGINIGFGGLEYNIASEYLLLCWR
ncbi:SubName: Full=Uncharacterized protein {ECO:0000313/EMBL:CCA74253.1} [Serendipita indica DSM 11827]|uniref:Uncharacterized protein n=1 Tax=Serendipita indica (strain DSM 11827) TaxID=1109443 RepID=G4TSG0_SERID|nr:SubName: Full=Uncharacterized protein {ECO:0000313/EMBL:CCA74253.1} [Serendipita indica DSM 11827]CCA74253.1 hypothetical protein PIIN_08206 [Serendipita indica DSM 11827]